ncbi:AMP-binding protein [Kitasatospora sp. NPDC050543]|uniref:AMP-binding protein n=1 Tax=Kitasatospora sp. NPDC050543 TaxID=3364054 RepID=UPI0037AB9F4E
MSHVLDLVRARTREEPLAPAVVTAAGTLGREALYRQAGVLAERLAWAGLRPGQVVLVHLGRTVELPVAVLGVLLAGGAFCIVDPADPAGPESRVHRLCEESGARIAVTAGLRLTVRREVQGGAGGRADLAYVVLTSGSTGAPKAVAMPHRGLDNLVSWTLATTSDQPLRTLQYAPPGFGVFVQEVFTAWCGGGALYLPTDRERDDPGRVAELLDEWRIERLFLPPVALARLAELTERTGRRPHALREVAVAGEALRITPGLRRFFAALPGCRLHNHYLAAETHVATAHTLPGPPERWPDSPPIGRPVAGTKARVVDGELWIAGPGLAHGYLNDRALTGRRFVPVAWAADGRAYRTGDLAVERPDGQLEYRGRADDQVKIDGHRVDPGEIEAVLAGHPAVRECAVAVREGEGERYLVAYAAVAARGLGGPASGAAGLREYLAGLLPAHLVPRLVLTLPQLPLSPNGRIDRARLPDPPPAAG